MIKAKKLSALVLTIAMVLSVVGTIPVFAATTTNPTINCTTGSNIGTSTDSYFWNNATKTLTLTNFTYSCDDAQGVGILLPDGATVELVGTNTLTVATGSYDWRGMPRPASIGIYGKGAVTVKGAGSLAINTTNLTPAGASVGIYANDSVTVTGGVTLNITTGDVTASAGSDVGVAINAGIYCIASTPILTINSGSTVTATIGKFTGKGNAEHGGLLTRDLNSNSNEKIEIDNSTVTVSCGEINASNNSSDNYSGIGTYSNNMRNKITIINNSTVKATGGKIASTRSSKGSYGIKSMILEISDSNVEATAGDTISDNLRSYGLYAEEGITITGSELKAKVGNASGDSSQITGIYSHYDATVSDSQVEITTGDATGTSTSTYIYGLLAGTFTMTENSSLKITTGKSVKNYGIQCTKTGKIVKSELDITTGNSTTESLGIYVAQHSSVTSDALDISDVNNKIKVQSGTAPTSVAIAAPQIKYDTTKVTTPANGVTSKVRLTISGTEREVDTFMDGENPAKLVEIGDVGTTPPTTPEIPTFRPSEGANVKIDKEYTKLAEVYFQGIKLVQTPIDATSALLSGYPGYTGYIGKVEQGSVKLSLERAFLRTLPMGTYTLMFTFYDNTGGTVISDSVVQQFILANDTYAYFPYYFTAPPTTYDVTLDYGFKTETVTVEHGKVATLPATPIREGYVFLGWYTDKELKNLLPPDTKVYEKATYYARWHKTVEATPPAVDAGGTDVPQTGDSIFNF